MRSCPECGATLPADARWCSLCYATCTAPGLPPPRPPVAYSRWDGDDVTLHRRARVYWTVGTLLLPLVALRIAGPFALVFATTWWLFVAPTILRDVWKRARV